TREKNAGSSNRKFRHALLPRGIDLVQDANGIRTSTRYAYGALQSNRSLRRQLRKRVTNAIPLTDTVPADPAANDETNAATEKQTMILVRISLSVHYVDC